MQLYCTIISSYYSSGLAGLAGGIFWYLLVVVVVVFIYTSILFCVIGEEVYYNIPVMSIITIFFDFLSVGGLQYQTCNFFFGVNPKYFNFYSGILDVGKSNICF